MIAFAIGVLALVAALLMSGWRNRRFAEYAIPDPARLADPAYRRGQRWIAAAMFVLNFVGVFALLIWVGAA